jgi:hypothetical protein
MGTGLFSFRVLLKHVHDVANALMPRLIAHDFIAVQTLPSRVTLLKLFPTIGFGIPFSAAAGTAFACHSQNRTPHLLQYRYIFSHSTPSS